MGSATDVVHRRCGDRPCEEMDDRVVEELRAFISQRYSSFMTSTLTFRHLKQHLSDPLGLPYGMFSLPDGRYADTLDDEVDAIAVRCDGGARDVECVSRPGYERGNRAYVCTTSRAMACSCSSRSCCFENGRDDEVSIRISSQLRSPILQRNRE